MAKRHAVPLHLIEGSRAHIRTQLPASPDAFFDICVDEEADEARRRTQEAPDAAC